MTDAQAHMALLKNNAQSDLTGLEKALHALDEINGGKGVREHAREVGKDHTIISDWVKGATVYREVVGHPTNPSNTKFLNDKVYHLAEISDVKDKAMWPAIVRHLIDAKPKWSVILIVCQIDESLLLGRVCYRSRGGLVSKRVIFSRGCRCQHIPQ